MIYQTLGKAAEENSKFQFASTFIKGRHTFKCKLYTFQINRKDPKTNNTWKPVKNSRVCSQHFPDGKPTLAYPDPVLNLGM